MIIKARAWNKQKKRMVYMKMDCETVEFFPSGKWNIMNWHNEAGKCKASDRDSVLMLSNGLSDKNKKEIYQGDIIKFKIDKLGWQQIVIKDFIKDTFLLTDLITAKGIPVEVIGNIYQNKKLINN